eukprot:755965-Hanusia_phi.AAC.1
MSCQVSRVHSAAWLQMARRGDGGAGDLGAETSARALAGLAAVETRFRHAVLVIAEQKPDHGRTLGRRKGKRLDREHAHAIKGSRRGQGAGSGS